MKKTKPPVSVVEGAQKHIPAEGTVDPVSLFRLVFTALSDGKPVARVSFEEGTGSLAFDPYRVVTDTSPYRN